MLIRAALAGLIALLAIAGCANQNKVLDKSEPMAMQTAISRGQSDLDCLSATGSVISRALVQPAMPSPFINGMRRAEFTISVAGCDKRSAYIVVCPEGGYGCFAAGPGPSSQDVQ